MRDGKAYLHSSPAPGTATRPQARSPPATLNGSSDQQDLSDTVSSDLSLLRDGKSFHAEYPFSSTPRTRKGQTRGENIEVDSAFLSQTFDSHVTFITV